jgi:hydroxyacylglutathione hydrolase
MIVDRVYTPGLAQVAYLVADEAAAEVAVIDPRRDVDPYLAWAAERGLRVTAILETHVHADFVSGARELAAATGAPVYAGRLGATEFPHVPLDDGDEIAVGRVKLRAFWTPGHTPEHVSYLLIDPARGPEPLALFSGDLLFVGEVGRPDLLGAARTRELADQLYESIVHRLSGLGDEVLVYPGHTAGSSCGKRIGDAPQTTIGQERRFNYAFQRREREGFVAAILEGMPRPPTYYPTLKRVNKVGPALLAALPAGEALFPAEVERRLATGALAIDTRSSEAFNAGHVPGAVFAGLGNDFVAWTGWLAPYERELILVVEDEEAYRQARTELRRIGLDRIAGFLAGGTAAWQASGRPVATLEAITPRELARRLETRSSLVVLDVRGDDEWQRGHIPGAVHRFAGEIVQGAEIPVNGATEIAVACASGYRSTVAASLLQARRGGVINVAGGADAWLAAGLPLAREEA